MDVAVDLDEATVRELEEEAQLQGFADLDAYLSWIIAHRPMSDLASTQAPAVASRVSELEERIKLVERQLGLDEPVDPDADLGDAGGGGGGSLDATGGDEFGGGFESAAGGGGDDLGGDEPEPDPDEPEGAAEDDDIAEAIGDVSLEDEEAEDGG